MPEAKADYHLVPTVVFSHPTIATVGYTEQVTDYLYSILPLLSSLKPHMQ